MRLRGIFAAARAVGPSVIFIDEIDALACARSSGQDSSSVGLVTTLLTLMDGMPSGASSGGNRVVVLAATNRPNLLDAALRRPGRFDRELEVGIPSQAGRVSILRARMRGTSHALEAREEEEVARSAHGFLGSDLAALVDEAAMVALRRVVDAQRTGEDASSEATRLVIGPSDMRAARTRVSPSALRDVYVEVPNVPWDSVGGVDDVKVGADGFKEVKGCGMSWGIARAG